jgi:hypothetical protein
VYGLVNGLLDGKDNEWMDRWVVDWMDERMDRWMVECMDECVDGWMLD